jgi:hypothetical protein
VDILLADNKQMVLSAEKRDLTIKVTYVVLDQRLKMTTRVEFGAYVSEETKIIDDWEADLACCLPVPMPLDKETGVSIYPEQIDTEAYLSVYKATVPRARVRIINTKGNIVLDKQLETCGLLQWDTAGLAPGQYLVRVAVNGKLRFIVASVSGARQDLARF